MLASAAKVWNWIGQTAWEVWCFSTALMDRTLVHTPTQYYGRPARANPEAATPLCMPSACCRLLAVPSRVNVCVVYGFGTCPVSPPRSERFVTDKTPHTPTPHHESRLSCIVCLEAKRIHRLRLRIVACNADAEHQRPEERPAAQSTPSTNPRTVILPRSSSATSERLTQPVGSVSRPASPDTPPSTACRPSRSNKHRNKFRRVRTRRCGAKHISCSQHVLTAPAQDRQPCL